jgi:hypothetical protein
MPRPGDAADASTGSSTGAGPAAAADAPSRPAPRSSLSRADASLAPGPGSSASDGMLTPRLLPAIDPSRPAARSASDGSPADAGPGLGRGAGGGRGRGIASSPLEPFRLRSALDTDPLRPAARSASFPMPPPPPRGGGASTCSQSATPTIQTGPGALSGAGGRMSAAGREQLSPMSWQPSFASPAPLPEQGDMRSIIRTWLAGAENVDPNADQAASRPSSRTSSRTADSLPSTLANSVESDYYTADLIHIGDAFRQTIRTRRKLS